MKQKHSLRSREAKRDVTFPCGEATLHWAKPCFILHAPQVRFISKQKSTALAVLFCLRRVDKKDATYKTSFVS